MRGGRPPAQSALESVALTPTFRARPVRCLGFSLTQMKARRARHFMAMPSVLVRLSKLNPSNHRADFGATKGRASCFFLQKPLQPGTFVRYFLGQLVAPPFVFIYISGSTFIFNIFWAQSFPRNRREASRPGECSTQVRRPSDIPGGHTGLRR